MLAKVFKAGISDGNSPVNYLLSDKDHTGTKRSVKPEVFRGDPNVTRKLINSIENEQKYTSGVLAFRANEQPTREQLHEICDQFEHYMFGGLDKNRINVLWVLHYDKGRPEAHFLVPKQDLKTGKQLNISPPGEKNQLYWRLWGAMINDTYGWEQITPQRKYDIKCSEYKSETNLAIFKRKMGSAVQSYYSSGQFKDRSDLVNWLSENQFEITKIGEDFITIKYNEKSVRLYGEVYKQNPDIKPNPPFVFDATAREKLEWQRLERVKYFSERFDRPARPRGRKPAEQVAPKPAPGFVRLADRIRMREEGEATGPSVSIVSRGTETSGSTGKSGSSSGGMPAPSGGKDTTQEKRVLGAHKSALIAKLAEETDPVRIMELRNELDAVDRRLGDIALQELQERTKEFDRLIEMNIKSIKDAPS
ncbi:relaxase/mobilization nuclease domain-containing protein [Paraburkholderia tropica]|uniref:relaxase/mobilization nuclease domain-containing protein n=1 Tax=Paraburkholderia tropica TaxID=92647 RepID=UPI003D2E150C